MKISEIITEDEGNVITLWHGGHGLESNYHELQKSSKGRWEHGPGLYLTNSYARAQKYAGGRRKVYKVTIRPGTDISKVSLDYSSIEHFARTTIIGKLRNQFLQDIKHHMERINSEHIPARVFLNLLINYDAVSSAKTPEITRFLIDHGIDYAIDTHGGFHNEYVVVLFNRSKIVKVEATMPKNIGSSDYDMKDIDFIREVDTNEDQ